MAKTLSAHEQSIARIFSDEYVFQVPGYQRPYSWTTEQARELIEDLEGFISDNPGEISEMPPYFLGSIVLIKQEANPHADVVDGQQRLTTLTLLLSAIRSRVSEGKGGMITRLLYEEGNLFTGTTERFRLSLRERDREFFQVYVQKEGGFEKLIAINEELTDSRRNIRDNARLFDKFLSELSEDEQVQLAQFVLTRCFLVVVSTPDLDSAYRIFSVLNSRGLELSATDILKADIVGATKESLRGVYTKRWEEAEEDLGRDAFGELFSHIRMIYRKAKPQGTLLKEFREHVTEVRQPEKFVDNILVPLATAFEELSDAAYSSSEGAEEVNEHLKWLNRLEFKDWMPPALAYSSRKRGQPSAMLAFFRDLERLAYAMLIARFGINERIDRFSKLTSAVESDIDLWADASPLQLSPAEQSVVHGKLDGPIYETLSARARSSLLLRLDALLSDGSASYDYPVVTVEHVLPQTPNEESQWLVWFPDSQERSQWVHRLGNLTLLARKRNSAASNFEFDRKKSAYFSLRGASPFVLTSYVLREQLWTPAIVAARHADLLNRLATHWRLGVR